jgi:hypothetical protein
LQGSFPINASRGLNNLVLDRPEARKYSTFEGLKGGIGREELVAASYPNGDSDGLSVRLDHKTVGHGHSPGAD